VNRKPKWRSGPRLDFDTVVYGIHSVEEAIGAGEALRGIHVARDRKKDATLRALLDRARERAIPVRFEDRSFFARLPMKAHQGVIAIVPPFEYAVLSDVLGKRRTHPALFVILDHLTDPHNVGAILRTSECAGVDAFVLPEHRSSGINATVRKTAAGAAGLVPVVQVANIAQTIRQLKENGVRVVGADAGSESLPMRQVDLSGDIALMIGAEGAGLGRLARRECDALVRIPMRGKLASLNASVAAGVLLYEILRQRDASA
jgi:23S rRNA (guanosine2251-2'-O)-methyltransferase